MALFVSSFLEEALSRPPIGQAPRKRTSVPYMTLYALLKYKQDRLAGRPLSPSMLERFLTWWRG